jgi:orotidine-5'-phosphate decarboxylase
MSTGTTPRIIVALDYPSAEPALALVNRLDPAHCRLKVGMELYTAAGPDLVRSLVERDFDVFLDLKFHDIPNTVAAACSAAAELGVWMMNVHCLGGRRMLAAAREAVGTGSSSPLLIGVTVLTSHSEQELAELGLADSAAKEVERLAGLARESGLDGVVCSPLEAGGLRQEFGAEFRLITPGVRPAGSDAADQRRTLSPEQAVAAGADWLVIGRPITRASDPVVALAEIRHSLGEGR